MSKNATWCSRVRADLNRPKCNEEKVVKNDKTKNNKQQYYCKICIHRFIENYTYQTYKSDIIKSIIELTKQGLLIRSAAGILKISMPTLL